MFLLEFLFILFAALLTYAQFADTPISRVSEEYFSDPFHVPYQYADKLHIAGTTHHYLVCDNSKLTPGCAKLQPNDYRSNTQLNQSAHDANAEVCGVAGIHPFQSDNGSWDALVTLHVVNKVDGCQSSNNWAVIVHAHPETDEHTHPPLSWTGDQVMIGNFSKNVDANYDGKYFQTPEGELFLVYQKQEVNKPGLKRDGVVAWHMQDPMILTPGDEWPRWLLLPGDDLNSENYVAGRSDFKLIETGNILPINNKYAMAYSVGAYNKDTYKIGIAWSDTFIPVDGYRKVMKNNPEGLWNSKPDKEVYYLLQSDKHANHTGWHYVRDQVLAPGVPTVAKIGADESYVLLFAGYDPNDAPHKPGTNKYQGDHRRPFFAHIDVNVPQGKTVKDATDSELQNWIVPSQADGGR